MVCTHCLYLQHAEKYLHCLNFLILFSVYRLLRIMAESQQEGHHKLDSIGVNVGKVLANLAPEEEIISPSNMPKLPIKTVADFLYFEKFLRDPSNMKSVVCVTINLKAASVSSRCMKLSYFLLYCRSPISDISLFKKALKGMPQVIS